MTDSSHDLAWRFGGLLAGLDQQTAWLVLGGTAFTGLLLILLSYRYSLVLLSAGKRFGLTGIRFLLLLFPPRHCSHTLHHCLQDIE